MGSQDLSRGTGAVEEISQLRPAVPDVTVSGGHRDAEPRPRAPAGARLWWEGLKLRAWRPSTRGPMAEAEDKVGLSLLPPAPGWAQAVDRLAGSGLGRLPSRASFPLRELATEAAGRVAQGGGG